MSSSFANSWQKCTSGNFETNSCNIHHVSFYMLYPYLGKLATIFTAYSTASNMKFPYLPIVMPYKYQVTLTVLRKKTFHIIKANVWTVAHEFSHRCTDSSMQQCMNGSGPCGARGRCRISPPHFLAESCKRWLNQSRVVLFLLYV